MIYNKKNMRLEQSAENPVHGGYYYAELLLPAADYELKDAMQRTRAVGRENTVEVSIIECDILPELQDIRMDTFSLDELNFFAKRLASLPDEGILKGGSKFENISVFQNGSLTNILFPFEDGLEIDMGKLAMWRLRYHEQFGGTWLSDYVPNRLGGFISEHEPDKIKPDCRLIGEDGNIFNLMGLFARTLRHSGLAEQATEMTGRIHECGSYDEALCIIGEYVNITGGEESEDEDEGMGMRL